MKYIRWVAILVITLTTGSCTDRHQKTVTITFAGDTMLGRLVNETITKRGLNILGVIYSLCSNRLT